MVPSSIRFSASSKRFVNSSYSLTPPIDILMIIIYMNKPIYIGFYKKKKAYHNGRLLGNGVFMSLT